MASRKWTSKRESSSSDSSYYCEKGVPKSASSWKRQQLESIGVFYEEKISTVSEITELLKERVTCKRHENYGKLPEIGKVVIELTKQLLRFSYESQEVELSLAEDLASSISEFESSVDDFKLKQNDLLKDKLNDRVFRRWSSYTADFLFYLRVFIARLQSVTYSSDMTAREGCFTQLFMSFMNMFLLKAEIGEAYKGEITVMGRRISGIPDVRFPCYSDRNKTVEVVTVAEVKHKARINKDKAFSINDLNDAVLGQHGIELLIERKNSYFKPAVSGIICIGSELIFTYLDIDEDKYVSLQEKEMGDRKSSSRILYTKPFNFLDMSDRSEILELCFWLGYLQLNAYKEMEL